MKLNYKLICAVITGLLLGSSVWAEQGAAAEHKMPAMSEQGAAVHESGHDMSSMHENAQGKMMEQTGDADAAMQDKMLNEPVQMEQSGFSRGSVVRSVFTSAVEDREPTDSIKELNTNSDKVIYYTELRDMAGQTAKHRWEYNGEVMAEVEFNVGGSRWRVWSSKSFVPGWTGEWKVSVLNGANEVISEDILNYTQSVAEPVVEKSVPATPVAVDTMQVQ